MAKIIKTTFRTIIIFLILTMLVFFSFVLYISLNDYQPIAFMSLTPNQEIASQIEKDTCFTITSWNLGYNGLGKEMDFFYDGGKKVRADKQLSIKYLRNNLLFIDSLKNLDFCFFQEVDVKSKRSYYVDQKTEIEESLTEHAAVFAKNYYVSWVPVPVFKPLGKVDAGMMTFSKYTPIENTRFAYPNIASWPDKLFLLDRCFILNRYLLPGKKHLVLINTHNSYYIKNDSLRKTELNVIRERMLEEYNRGNYVIAGGDWNRLPADFYTTFKGNIRQVQASMPMFEKDFLPPEWIWVYDSTAFTNRELNTSFDPDLSKQSVIDYFIVSPNIEVVENYVYQLNFENSDHNPVYMKFKLMTAYPHKTNQQ